MYFPKECHSVWAIQVCAYKWDPYQKPGSGACGMRPAQGGVSPETVPHPEGVAKKVW